jgi:Co/Zn/Cd efflux system component
MAVFGLGVLAEAVSKIIVPVMPSAGTMGVVGGLALLANLGCFTLLYRHRSDNLNMSSTWVCSRNDVIANIGVLCAAAAGGLLASRWPDIAVGVAIAVLFLRSAFSVLQQARNALRERPVVPARHSPRALDIRIAK